MRRSGPPKRRAWLKRGKPLRSRARRPKRYQIERQDEQYKAWVRTQRCMVAEELGHDGECAGPIHAAHLGESGLGQKACDSTCAPLCERHHLRDQHDHAPNAGGFFARRSRLARIGLYAVWLVRLHQRYRAQGGVLAIDRRATA